VGSDPFGDFLVERLGDAGLPDRFVEQDPIAKTTLAFVTHDDNADRSFTFYRNGTADTRMKEETIPDSLLETMSTVYVGGVLLASEPSRTAIFDLVRRAQSCDCTVVFDPNYRPELWTTSEFEPIIREILAFTDVVKATPEEFTAAGLSVGDTVSLCESVCELGPSTILMTQGEDGALAYTTDSTLGSQGITTHSGFDVDVVDTTGAGDAFLAGVLATLATENTSLRDVLETGNAVAALATTTTGGMESLPDRDSVQEFIEIQANTAPRN
jgi:fructokinase